MKKFVFEGIDDLKVGENDSCLDKNSPGIYCMGLCLNSGCMYDCIYCYARGNKEYSSVDKLSLSEYKNLITIDASVGCKTIIITGVSSPSEPLLSKYLVELITFISQYEMNTVIYTNAYILGDNSMCEKVHNCSVSDLISLFYNNKVSLMISCDSLNKENYNRIVQKENAYNVLLNALENLIQGGFKGEKVGDIIKTRVAVSCVISKINILDLDEMKTKLHKNNWQYICKFPSLMGNALKYYESFFTPEEVSVKRSSTSDLYTDKQETLVIKSDKGNEYCLANQLGIAINGMGQVLSCLSGDLVFDPEVTIRNVDLKELIIRKKNKFGLQAGHCPKKRKFYK